MHIVTLDFGVSPCKLCQLCWRPNLVSVDIWFPIATKQSCVCVGCGGGSVCLLALSTKARWKIARSYKQQIGNLIKIWCAQTRAYHCFSCVNLGFLGCHLRVFFSFKVDFFLNHFMAHFSRKHEHLWVMVPELLIWVESSLRWSTPSSQL